MWPTQRHPEPRLLPQVFQLVLVVGALIISYHLLVFVWERTAPPEVTVPEIVGLSETEATRLLSAKGLRGEVVTRRWDEKVPEGSVITSHPPGGRRVRLGRVVQLTVSSGSRWAVVPDVGEMSVDRARALLNQAKLNLGNQRAEYDPTVPIGYVIRQAPEPGRKVPRGTDVTLWLSKGPAPDAGQVNQPERPSGTRSTDVIYTVPAGADLQEVLIVVHDQSGDHTVYRGYHQPGETIKKRVTGTGDSVAVEVYLSDLLVERREF